MPMHAGDVDRAEVLLRWIAELAGYKPNFAEWRGLEEHSLLIAADSALPQERVKAMLAIVREGFHSVRAMIVNTGAVGWPLAANLMWKAAARQIQEAYRLPWLWLEPDAVPLREDWLDRIGEAYRRCPRPFMGHVLDAERAIEGLPNRYLAGTAVYPQDTFGLLATRWNDAKFAGMAKPPKLATATWQQNVRAWDMVFANDLVPRAQHTPLIQHFWGTDYGTPPLFVPARTEADPPNAVTLSLIKPETLLFHRVKDLNSFLALWRLKLESEQQSIITAEKPMNMAPGFQQAPGEPNPNFKGGPEADKERRKAAAARSKEYLEQARQQRAQQAAQQGQVEPRVKQTESVTV
jgi:hypothetical protein